jgi:RNA polymerase sigma-70 factor (ECF subfamily)
VIASARRVGRFGGVGGGAGRRLTEDATGRRYDRAVSRERPSAEAPGAPVPADLVSRRWVEELRPGHPAHGDAVARLHGVLRRVARSELFRRAGRRGSLAGPELDDMADQCADDALLAILAKLDEFAGLSRFTTWAVKFVIFEVSSKLARHVWLRRPPAAGDDVLDRLPDVLAPEPAERAERKEQLAALRRAIDHDLTPRQRRVFVAVALNEVPIDVLALELGSNRNALYKNLFDARRRLRAGMAAAGYPVGGEEASG